MGFRAAELDVVYRADTRQVDAATRSVERNLDRTAGAAQTTGKRFGGAMAGMGRAVSGVGGMIVSAGIVMALRQIGDAASDLNETVSFTEVTFKSAAGEMKRWADGALESLGMARTTALDAANQFGGLLQVTGSTADEAADLSKELTQLAADMASAKNVGLDEAVIALGSGLRGEAEPMRRFNVLLSEAAVSAYAYKNGIAEAGAELTEGQKVQARLGVVMEQTTDIQGDYARTADSAANSQRRAEEAAKDAAATMGQELAPIMAKVYGQVADLAEGFGELPGPIQNVVLGLMGFGAALPFLVRTGSAAASTARAIRAMNAAEGAAGAPLTAMKLAAMELGESMGYVKSGTQSMMAGFAAGGAIIAAATIAVVAWTHAFQAAAEAAEAAEESTASSVALVETWGRQLEAGTISQDEFNKKVAGLAPAAVAGRKGIDGLADSAGAFLTGQKSSNEITEERNQILAASKGVLDRYRAAEKKLVLEGVSGQRNLTTVTTRSLKTQWRFRDMDLEKYREWAAGTRTALNGVQGKLADLAGRARLTAGGITRAFDRQLTAAREYADDWGDVMDRGLAKKAPELVAQLQEMGLEGAGIVNALANANRDEYQRIIRQWNEAQRIADSTSTQVIRSTKTWGGETKRAMDPATQSLADLNRELAELKQLAGAIGSVDVKVTNDLPEGGPGFGLSAGVAGSAGAAANALTAMYPGLVVTSTYRPGDPGYHGVASNPAHDVAMGGWPLDESGIFNATAYSVFQSAIATLGSKAREIIYGSWEYTGGQIVPYGGNDHWGHVHIADEGLIAVKRQMVVMGGAAAGGSEAAIPLRSTKGRAELARAVALGLTEAGGSLTGMGSGDVRALIQEIRRSNSRAVYRQPVRPVKDTTVVRIGSRDLHRETKKRAKMGLK